MRTTLSSVYFSPLSPISADFSLRSSLLLQTEKDHRVTDYATTGILSKAIWLWMDPLLNAGTKQPLEAADVPLLGASDLTLTVYRKLQSKWLQQEESSRSVWRASVNAFWPQFVVIGGIVFAKSIVVYVGSLLIQRFSDFTAGTSRNYEYEGYVLVGVLPVSECCVPSTTTS
jgi:hypothetical protein